MEKFKKAVIWGYPLNTHTHSFIHYGFKKAFESLGYETKWFTDSDDVSGFDFENCIFITMGSQEQNIPLNKSSYYVLHNVDGKKYFDYGCKVLFLQTIAKDVIKEDNTKIFNRSTVLKYNHDVNCLYTPWATDLLPEEIDLNNAVNQINNKYCAWIGTYGGGDSEFQNGSEIVPFFNECTKNGIKINAIDPWVTPISFEENLRIVRSSYLSPSLQGPWQIKNEYIPCRIFKNISYGHLGITNNPIVNEIFDNQLIFDRNPVQLFHKCIEAKNDPNTLEKIKFLMEEVKNKHTYINRVNTIIECLP